MTTVAEIALDTQQTAIVNATESNIIVSAGAGSGKTRTLTERVKRLLQEGADPKSIIVITFTNMAADELLSRLKHTKGYSDCFIGTIHSFARKLLKTTGYDFDIYSTMYEHQYMQYLTEHYAKYATYADYCTYADLVSQIPLGKVDASDIPYMFHKNVYDEICVLLGNANRIYTSTSLNISDYPMNVPKLCKLNNVITFDELLILSTTYFNENNIHIQHLFVDEFQDIGRLEFNFLMALKADNNFFIGDDYQSIYAFKGGDVNIFMSLMKSNDWKTYYLSNNYRNGSDILDLADSVIKRADNIISKSTVCCSNRKGNVTISSKAILSKYLQNFNQKYNDLQNWFFLVRTNKDLNYISKMLSDYKIPQTTFKNSNMSKAQRDKLLKSNCVKVLTIHTAKGLESKHVVLYGDLPLNPKKHCNSDELKVLYVGITRAEEDLLMFC